MKQNSLSSQLRCWVDVWGQDAWGIGAWGAVPALQEEASNLIDSYSPCVEYLLVGLMLGDRVFGVEG